MTAAPPPELQRAPAPPTPSKNLFIPELRGLSWGSDTEIEASIHHLYRYAERRADESIRWYLRSKGPKALASRGLRMATIGFTTLGGLAPVIAALGWMSGRDAQWVGQLGYLFLGLAAASVGVDKFFGFSSAWMRYITSALFLERALSEFRLEWAMLRAKLGGRPPTPDQVQLMIQRIKEFVLRVDSEVEKETQEWISEFQKNLAEIERSAQSRAESARPGAIDVTVANGMETGDGFTVSLDGMTVATVRGTRYQVGYVPPGTHKVAVSGRIGGKALDASELVNVPPGAIAKVALALPVEEAQP
jgi:hypothetical protein